MSGWQKVNVGGTEDDKMTWTGKRVRNDGTVEQSSGGVAVGKYLKKDAISQQPRAPVVKEDEIIEEDLDSWEEPVRKKAKSGGFGNFDNW